MTVCQNLFQAMFTMAGTGIVAFVNFMVKNWLTYLQATISGGIAGITAYKVYQSLPTDDVKKASHAMYTFEKERTISNVCAGSAKFTSQNEAKVVKFAKKKYLQTYLPEVQ